MHIIGGGGRREWGGWWGGWEAEGGLYLLLQHTVVSLISDRNRFNPQDRPRQSLAAVRPDTHSY